MWLPMEGFLSPDTGLLQKYGIRTQEPLHGKPHIITAGNKQRIIYLYGPYARSRILEPHDNQKTAGYGIDDLIIDIHH